MTYGFLNGHTCYFEVAGEGPPLLFLHGGFGGSTAPGGASGPKPWLEQVSRRHRVISYDRRSAGRSARPTQRHTLTQFVDDACALLDHLEVTSTAVWAVSAGCAIGLTLALTRPERVSALILSDGAPWFSRDRAMTAALAARIALLERDGPQAAYDQRRRAGPVGPRVFAGEAAITDAAERAKLAAQRERMRALLAGQSATERVAGYAAELRTQQAYLDFDVSDRLGELRMPVLVLHGTDDRVFPDVGWDEHAARLSTLQYVPVEGAHGAGVSPRAVEVLLEFLGSVGAVCAAVSGLAGG